MDVDCARHTIEIESSYWLGLEVKVLELIPDYFPEDSFWKCRSSVRVVGILAPLVPTRLRHNAVLYGDGDGKESRS